MMSEKDKRETDRQSVLNSVDDGHNVFGNASETTAERRPVLKRLAISIGSALGLAGTATADSDGRGAEIQRKTEAAMEGYETPSSVNTALIEHATGLLTQLGSTEFSGPITSEDFRATDVNMQKAPAEVDPAEGTYVTASKYDGTFSAHISIIRKTSTHVLRLNVRPQLDQSFATIKTRDGETIAVVDPRIDDDSSEMTGESDDVSIKKVCGSDGHTCPPGSCCFNCGRLQVKHTKTCCKYSDGSVSCSEEPIDSCCDPVTCC